MTQTYNGKLVDSEGNEYIKKDNQTPRNNNEKNCGHHYHYCNCCDHNNYNDDDDDNNYYWNDNDDDDDDGYGYGYDGYGSYGYGYSRHNYYNNKVNSSEDLSFYRDENQECNDDDNDDYYDYHWGNNVDDYDYDYDYYDYYNNNYEYNLYEIDHKIHRNTSDVSHTRNPQSLTLQQMRVFVKKYPGLKNAFDNYQHIPSGKSNFEFMKKLKKEKAKAKRNKKNNGNHRSNRTIYD